MVGYELGIPDELENILVLDASYPIRRLCQLDSSMMRGGRFGENIKRFDNVVMHSMKASSGRSFMVDSFSAARKDEPYKSFWRIAMASGTRRGHSLMRMPSLYA